MASTVWKGHLTFGLVSFPVRLYSAARSESISFNQLHKADGSRIKQVLFCQSEDKQIPRSEIVKGYEYEKDRYVVIEDEEIKKVAPQTAKIMEILEFVPNDQVDPIYLETSYYMAPDEAGEKPYALLIEALAGDFEPEKYKDNYRENLLQMIEAKKQGAEVVATPEPQQAKVVDIMEALKASLAMVKKPAASATTAEPAAVEEVRPVKRRARG